MLELLDEIKAGLGYLPALNQKYFNILLILKEAQARIQKAKGGGERRAAAKRNVGLFTTKVTWPMGVAAEAADVGYKDWMRMRLWRETLEEAATLKVKHRMDLPAGLVDEMAEAWRAGQHKTVTRRAQTMFGLSDEASAELGGLMERWDCLNLIHEKRLFNSFEGKFNCTAI